MRASVHACMHALKAAEKSTKSSTCTNLPVNCRLCRVVKWSMLGHMRKEHTDYPTDECAIPQEEANNVKDKISQTYLINGLAFCKYCCFNLHVLFGMR